MASTGPSKDDVPLLHANSATKRPGERGRDEGETRARKRTQAVGAGENSSERQPNPSTAHWQQDRSTDLYPKRTRSVNEPTRRRRRGARSLAIAPHGPEQKMQALKLARKYPSFSQEEMMQLVDQFKCVSLALPTSTRASAQRDATGAGMRSCACVATARSTDPLPGPDCQRRHSAAIAASCRTRTRDAQLAADGAAGAYRGFQGADKRVRGCRALAHVLARPGDE